MNKEDFVILEMENKGFDNPIKCWIYEMDDEYFYIMLTSYEVHECLRKKKRTCLYVWELLEL